MKLRRTTKSLLLATFVITATIVPTLMISKAQAIKQQQDIEDMLGGLGGPEGLGSMLGGIMGGIGGPTILMDMMMMIFNQTVNFNDQEMLDNVFVFNATSSLGPHVTTYTRDEVYTTWAPFVDTNGHQYRVEVNRSIDVSVSVTQEASIVIILWDNDGSLITIIRKLLEVVNMGLDYADPASENGTNFSENEMNSLISKAVEVGTYIIIHINDIFTGDEQFIVQPTYYLTYNVTGDMSDTRKWTDANNGYSEVPDPSTIPGLNESAANDEYLKYLMTSTPPWSGTFSDTAFFFHLFQFWMKKFQISLNMSKLATAITNPNASADAFANVLEGIDIEFAITQHHLLGGVLFNDTNGDNVTTTSAFTTPEQYTDSEGTKNVTVPQSSEVKYLLDLGTTGGPWQVKDPTRMMKDGAPAVSWGVTFTNPTIQCRPVGMSEYDYYIGGYDTINTFDMTNLSFGFSFQPSFEDVLNPANGQVVKFGKGVVKVDQEFGTFSGPTLGQNITNLSLAIVYFTHVLDFKLDFDNDAVEELPEEVVKDETRANTTGTLDFYDDIDDEYFANIDIAGPNYVIAGNPPAAAHTTTIPLAFLHFTYEGESYSDNDMLSIQEGEGDFRRQTLFVDITSGVALYAICYPDWDGTHLIHDPTFSIYMTLPSEVPWGWILLLVTIGAIAACAIIVYFKKQGRF
ncbi:MAG: hypothetical protein ACFFCS_27580 [Candidatus Hodarchaeota archaeon]